MNIKNIFNVVLFSVLFFLLSSCSGSETEGVSVDIKASEGILISLDGINYTESVKLSNGYYSLDNSNKIVNPDTTKKVGTDIDNDAFKSYTKEFRFSHVTSLNSSLPGLAENTTCLCGLEAGKVFKNTSGEEAIPNTQFLEFVMYFKSLTEQNLYLGEFDPNIGYVNSQMEEFKYTNDFMYKGQMMKKNYTENTDYSPKSEDRASITRVGEVFEFRPSNSFRMSFCNQNNELVLICSDKQINSEENYKNDNGGVFSCEKINGVPLDPQDFLSVAYYNSAMERKICNKEIKSDNSFLAPEMDYDYEESVTNKPLLALKTNSQNKLIVRVWSEGWDGDAVDSDYNNLQVKLNFKSSSSSSKKGN